MPNSLNSFHLKLIAIVSMFINHIGYIFKEEYAWPIWTFAYLSIGLLTYPIMAYLLVQGFHYTRNRWKYAGRMALFWILSILPFHYAFGYSGAVNLVNNVMFTLMMGIFLMMVCEKVNNQPYQILLVCLFSLVTLQSDWAIIGIVMIYGFYISQKKDWHSAWVIWLSAILLMLIFSTAIPDRSLLTGNVTIDSLSRLGILGTIPLLNCYNRQRGYNPLWVKWGFYCFYPLHLSLLALIL
ncbi:TraX family protein [Streptococcus sp. H49]|uniref:TraX family protein n=1 Tax=Streptococcus huangxiaojuni TaxID=3237239 RepID=UPI0034A48A5D